AIRQPSRRATVDTDRIKLAGIAKYDLSAIGGGETQQPSEIIGCAELEQRAGHSRRANKANQVAHRANQMPVWLIGKAKYRQTEHLRDGAFRGEDWIKTS